MEKFIGNKQMVNVLHKMDNKFNVNEIPYYEVPRLDNKAYVIYHVNENIHIELMEKDTVYQYSMDNIPDIDNDELEFVGWLILDIYNGILDNAGDYILLEEYELTKSYIHLAPLFKYPDDEINEIDNKSLTAKYTYSSGRYTLANKSLTILKNIDLNKYNKAKIATNGTIERQSINGTMRGSTAYINDIICHSILPTYPNPYYTWNNSKNIVYFQDGTSSIIFKGVGVYVNMECISIILIGRYLIYN